MNLENISEENVLDLTERDYTTLKENYSMNILINYFCEMLLFPQQLQIVLSQLLDDPNLTVLDSEYICDKEETDYNSDVYAESIDGEFVFRNDDSDSDDSQ